MNHGKMVRFLVRYGLRSDFKIRIMIILNRYGSPNGKFLYF